MVVCPLGVLTGSRDKTVKVWAPDEATGSYSLVQTLVGHTDFVVAVLYVPPGANDDYPAGAIVSGRQARLRQRLVVPGGCTGRACCSTPKPAWQL